MKHLFFVFIFCVCSFFYAQTADEIITTHLEKTGGIENWKKLSSVKLKGEAVLSLTEAFPIEIIQKAPNLNKSTIFINKKPVVLEGFDGKQGYRTNFTSGKKEIISNYQAEDFQSDLLNYTEKGFTAEYTGTEKVDKQDCYKVKLTKDNVSTTYYFSTKTYYLLKEISKNETIEYSNYKKVSNYVMAFSIESTSTAKDSDFKLNISTIEVNKPIADKEFKY